MKEEAPGCVLNMHECEWMMIKKGSKVVSKVSISVMSKMTRMKYRETQKNNWRLIIFTENVLQRQTGTRWPVFISKLCVTCVIFQLFGKDGETASIEATLTNRSKVVEGTITEHQKWDFRILMIKKPRCSGGCRSSLDLWVLRWDNAALNVGRVLHFHTECEVHQRSVWLKISEKIREKENSKTFFCESVHWQRPLSPRIYH